MTKLLTFPTITQQAGNIAQGGGSAPVGSSMQGNPKDTSDRQNTGVYPPGPQCGSATQVLGASPGLHDLIARGAVPHNTAPTSANVVNGTDSLLAQIARGQVILKDTTYGISQFIPQNAGASPQAQTPAAAQVQPIAALAPSAVTITTPPTYTGD